MTAREQPATAGGCESAVVELKECIGGERGRVVFIALLAYAATVSLVAGDAVNIDASGMTTTGGGQEQSSEQPNDANLFCKASGECAVPKLPAGQARSMWVSPVFSVNLAPLITAAENDRFFTYAVTLYRLFQERKEDWLAGIPDPKPTQATDMFYAWQRANPAAINEALEFAGAHLQHLKAFCARAVSMSLRAAGLVFPPDTIQSHNVDMWVGVLNAHEGHPAHVHKDSFMSGTYYVRVPKGSGDIVLHDPRGPLPPFEHFHPISPAEQDVVVFPSWLVHHVEHGTNTEPRIALSFNVQGPWDLVSDLSMAYMYDDPEL